MGQMQSTDWLNTILVKYLGLEAMGKTDGIPVDVRESDKSYHREILLNIDPYYKRPYGGYTPPLEPYKTESGFNTTKGNAGIIYNQFKLLTGDPGIPNYSSNYDTRIRFTSNDSNENTQSVRLYNIQKDHTERHDLSKQYPELVEFLLHRLNYYNTTIIQTPYFPACTAAGDPNLHNGFWGPF